jgi:hypothetical protein
VAELKTVIEAGAIVRKHRGFVKKSPARAARLFEAGMICHRAHRDHREREKKDERGMAKD